MGTDSKSFWTGTDSSNIYAKRNNLFLVQFGMNRNSVEKDRILRDMSGLQFVAKSVNLPSFTISQPEMDRNGIEGESAELVAGYLDWQPVTLTFSDIVHRENQLDPLRTALPAQRFTDSEVFEDAAFLRSGLRANVRDYSSLYQSLMYAFSRAFGPAVYQSSTAFNRKRFRQFFNLVEIISINDVGLPIDKWKLKRIWPTEFRNSDLSYEDDGIREFSITLDYITAEYTSYKSDGSTEFIRVFRETSDADEGETTIFGGDLG